MGTSLSGLTPATTFDGLLKVGDNDPLTAELKAISTGDGTDTILQLSTTALQIGGTLDLNFAGQTNVPMQFYGAGNQQHYIAGGNGLEIDYVTTKITENVRLAYNVANRDVSIGESNSMGAKLGIKGSGVSADTTSLLVQNSDGLDVLKINDDGDINMLPNTKTLTIGSRLTNGGEIRITPNNQSSIQWQGSNGIMYMSGRGAGIFLGDTAATPTARLHIKGSGNDNTTNALLVQNSDGTDLLKVTNDGIKNARQAFFVNHLTNSLRSLRLGWGSLHATDNASELNIGAVYSQPTAPKIVLSGKTRASGADAIQVQTLNGMYIAPTANTENPSAQLHVKVENTQDTIARFQDPVQTWSYIDIKNDSVLTDYTGIFWGGKAKIRSKEVGPLFIDCAGGVSFLDGNSAKSNINSQGAIAIGANAAPASTMAYIKGSGNDNTTTSLLVQNSDGTQLLKVADNGATTIGAIGTGYPTITTQGQYGAITTDAFSYMAFRMNGNDVVRVTSTRDVGIGTTGPTAKLHIKGSGATSATTALLVQDSAGTDLLKVRDDGWIEGISTLNSISVRVSGALQIGSTNFKVDNTNTYFQSQYTNNVFGGTSTDGDASALVTMKSTTQGFLPPRMTDAERDAIATPAAGLMIYDTTNNQMNYWNGSTWIAF